MPAAFGRVCDMTWMGAWRGGSATAAFLIMKTDSGYPKRAAFDSVSLKLQKLDSREPRAREWGTWPFSLRATKTLCRGSQLDSCDVY